MHIKLDEHSGVAFVWKKDGAECPFIELAGSVDSEMPVDILVRKFKSYAIIERDLNIAKECFIKVSSLSEDEISIMDALIESAIFSYSRPFAAGYGKNVQLDGDEVFKNNPEMKASHDLLRNLRNQFSAHVGENLYEKVMIYIALAPKPLPREVIEIYRGLVRTTGFNESFYSDSVNIINVALEWIKIRQDFLYREILQEVKNVNISELYAQAHLPQNIVKEIQKITIA